MSDLIYNVQYLMTNSDGYLSRENKTHYNIPAYQRGYKWTSREVETLLENVSTHKIEVGKFYCLHNITLVPYGQIFNVVDGQQRLTSLIVILSFLGKTDGLNRILTYQIRPETQVFLDEYIMTWDIEKYFKQDISASWNEFIKTHSNSNHQDIYHLFSAAFTVQNWFAKTNVTKDEFANVLLYHVKIIVNKVREGNEEKIFGNLNSKRIPLDGADLVRAILITRVAQEEGQKAGDIKNIVRVNERRVRIGWEIDEINSWWSNEEVSLYFRQFVAISSVGEVSFDIIKHPINLLLLLFAEKNGKTGLSLEFIEKHKSAMELYIGIIQLHHVLKDWYEDRELYHFLGYLFNQFKPNTKFKSIISDWYASKSRLDFKMNLKNKIKKGVFNDREIADVFTSKKDNWYDKPTELVKVLLLLDVIACLPKETKKLPAHFFRKTGNDIEHIFPQTPKTIEDRKPFIQFLIAEKKIEDIDKGILDDFDRLSTDNEYQLKLAAFIIKYTQGIKINSIGNLVLLFDWMNRGFKNSIYPIKRMHVVRYFNSGQFIQPHTFKVFARYFISENQMLSRELEHWTNDDIERNESAIMTSLTNFFKLK